MCKLDRNLKAACAALSAFVLIFISGSPAYAQENGNNTVFFSSLAGIAVLSIYAIVTAPVAAKNDNETFGKKPEARKNPSTALAWSLGATLIPTLAGTRIMQQASEESGNRAGFVLIAVGMGIGPSTGHFYAGQTKRGIVTAIVRLGLGVVALATLDLTD